MDEADLPQGLPARYRPVRLLGRGSFGRVVLARDQAAAREVAIKLLDQVVADPAARARFAREARLTASLDHPNLVRVHDHGVTEADQAYIVYELVAGPDLERRAAREPALTRGEILAIGAAVARGLAAVHGAGILHRDVKPANVLLRADGTPVLADFGLARPDRPGASLTATGTIMGTPAYMAPELWAGRPASPASDQFAWAASLFELVYRVPVWGEGRLDALMARATAGKVPEPPAGLRGVHPGLERVLARALDPDPAARFPGLPALAEALEAVPAHEAAPVRAAPTMEVEVDPRAPAAATRVLAGPGPDPDRSLATRPEPGPGGWARRTGLALGAALASLVAWAALGPGAAPDAGVPPGTPDPAGSRPGAEAADPHLLKIAAEEEALRRELLALVKREIKGLREAVRASSTLRFGHWRARRGPPGPWDLWLDQVGRWLHTLRRLDELGGAGPRSFDDPERRRAFRRAVLVLGAPMFDDLQRASVPHLADIDEELAQGRLAGETSEDPPRIHAELFAGLQPRLADLVEDLATAGTGTTNPDWSTLDPGALAFVTALAELAGRPGDANRGFDECVVRLEARPPGELASWYVRAILSHCQVEERSSRISSLVALGERRGRLKRVEATLLDPAHPLPEPERVWLLLGVLAHQLTGHLSREARDLPTGRELLEKFVEAQATRVEDHPEAAFEWGQKVRRAYKRHVLGGPHGLAGADFGGLDHLRGRLEAQTGLAEHLAASAPATGPGGDP